VPRSSSERFGTAAHFSIVLQFFFFLLLMLLPWRHLRLLCVWGGCAIFSPPHSPPSFRFLSLLFGIFFFSLCMRVCVCVGWGVHSAPKRRCNHVTTRRRSTAVFSGSGARRSAWESKKAWKQADGSKTARGGGVGVERRPPRCGRATREGERRKREKRAFVGRDFFFLFLLTLCCSSRSPVCLAAQPPVAPPLS
jgi:hypothetical protein